MNKKTYTDLNHFIYFKAIKICVFRQQLIVVELQNTHMNDQYIPRGFAKLDHLNPRHSIYHDFMAIYMYGGSLEAIWSPCAPTFQTQQVVDTRWQSRSTLERALLS